ncbi:hypothetical protein ES703_69984 [subsurface metagenome]
MEKLNIKHTCPGCNERFKDDYDFAAHIANDHDEDFIDQASWIFNLPNPIFIMADVMISGNHG